MDKGAGGCRNGGIKAHGSGITPVFCRASGLSGNSTRLRCQRKAISQPRAALNNVHSGLRKTCFQSLSTLCTNVFSTASTTCSVAFKLDAQSYRCYSPAQKKQVLNLSRASRLRGALCMISHGKHSPGAGEHRETSFEDMVGHGNECRIDTKS